MSIVSVTQADMMTGRTALLGITTPLAGLSIPVTDASEAVVAIVTARLGALTADVSAGAVVRGNGSNLLWIAGTAAQVNAELATLTYAGTTEGTDDLAVSILSANGTLTPMLQSSIGVVPLNANPSASNNLVAIESGTLTLEARTLDGPSLNLREPAGSLISTTGVLINTTIGVHSEISVRNDNGIGSVMPRIAMAGRVELDGTMMFAGNDTLVSLAQGATFVNDGSISIEAHAAQFTGTGSLINNGTILLTGDGTSGTPSRIDTSVSGSGVVSLTGGASVEIGAAVGAGETVWLDAGANTLHLAQPANFAGQIGGFSSADLLVLDGTTVTNAVSSHTAETDSSVVTLFNGTSIVGTIQFNAPQADTMFQLGTDAAGNTTIGLAPVKSTTSIDVDVFRFFDAAHGTQLLTEDPAERDSIISSRPDLHYEGVGMHALDPAQPGVNATAVYRFFDTTNGTHFMTASATERDALIGSRPDLVFEPGSTLFEHATAQAGDAAVYRFFDTSTGAHFFTADAGERATLIATRPDMTLEGIAFYAPTT